MIASSEFMQTLAWSLLHFLWQGAAIAAVAAAIMLVFRTPSARYLVGVGALALMFVAFGVTFAVLSSSGGDAGVLSASAAPTTNLVTSLAATLVPPAEFVSTQTPAAIDSGTGYLWVAQLWLAGVCVLALRVAFGLLLLEHLRRRNLVALPAELVAKFRALQQRLGIQRVVRYCECRLVGAPAVIGFFRPIVLLPVRALTGLSDAQLEAVIAHELGHIKRFDVAVNFFQVIAETLFFFHPAVWWLNKRIRADREDCCDDIAVAASGANVGYARALATMAGWRDVPTFAMAATGGPVAARVARLLGVSQNTGATRHAGVVTASLVLVAAVVAGAVSLGIAQPAIAQTSEASANPEVVKVPPPSPAKAPAPTRPPAPPAPVVKEVPNAKPVTTPRASAQSGTPNGPRGPSFIAQMESVGLTNLDVEHLVALKIHDITPEYIRAVRASGMNPDVEELIAIKIHDVTPAYLQEMRALGFDPDLDALIAMKVHGITPAYVKQMRDAGFNPDAEEIVAMKIHEITPEYRKVLESAGFKLDVEDLISAKVMDITPEFINDVRAHGFKDLDMDQLIQLKNADVL